MLHVCVSTDKNYETMTKMCMYDIITRKNKDTEITFYVLVDQFDGASIAEFNEIEGITVNLIHANSQEMLPTIDMSHLHSTRLGITKATYLRFLIPSLPQFQNIRRILYIDCDFLARRDISGIYNAYIDDLALGMVRDTFYIRFENLKEQMMRDGAGYNAGLMLMDLPRLRKLNFTDMGLYISAVNNYNDQTTINRAFRDEIYQLDPINQIPIHNLVQHIPRMGDIREWNNFHETKYKSIEEIVDRSYFWHFHESKGWQMQIKILHDLFYFSLNRLMKYEATHHVEWMDPELDQKINEDFKRAISADGSTNCAY